eukprot:TRINITY_DN8913_c0_g1_i1.p1 TRINITY_DN8913_c0_g1~~TRINITY_DN8913_c0_g1_i1.p1  ORF type:complete len:340 (+),score=1.00 TRINITY_DN8913_c0_g1_i1:243-1262(+)
MGCRGSKAQTGSRPSLKEDPNDLSIQSVGVSPMDYSDPRLFDQSVSARFVEPDFDASQRPEMSTIVFESGEEGQPYQGQLNARLAAMILQKRATRNAARGTPNSSPPASGQSTPTSSNSPRSPRSPRSPGSRRKSAPSSAESTSNTDISTSSGLPPLPPQSPKGRRSSKTGELLDDSPPGAGFGSSSDLAGLIGHRRRGNRDGLGSSGDLRASVAGLGSSGDLSTILGNRTRRNSASSRDSTGSRGSRGSRRTTRIKWDAVEVNEFARDFNCACSQPSSGGLPLGMGMYHVKCSRQSLDEFESSRKLSRIPVDRFHITGRLSPLERGKLLDHRRGVHRR